MVASRLRAAEIVELFTRIFSASEHEARGSEHERLQLVPLVFGLLPRAALARKRPDDRIKPAIRAHLASLGIDSSELLVDTIKDIADQYFAVVFRPPSERPRKLGVESVRARGEVYKRIRQRQADRCAVCGVRLGKDATETLDHIIPWSLAGDRPDGSNWQLLCDLCNGGKREWLSALQSAQAANWHYGLGDPVPFEPTQEARYVVLAVAGKCQAHGCEVRPRDGHLSVHQRHASGLAIVDNLLALCEAHAVADAAADSTHTPDLNATPGKTSASPAPSVRDAEAVEVIVRFGGYALMSRATGGMAESFFAVDEETGEEVFLKRAREESPDCLALQREASIYTKFQYRVAEHVPRVLGADHLGGYFYLVTERAETDLEKYVRARGHVSTKEARSILLQVVDGLREIHGMEIVHRDLKPANILRIGERWVLADFGISKDRMSSGGGTFQLRGTSGYAAPEQILTGVDADASADIFALGKLIVFLITGGTDIDRITFRGWRDIARSCTTEDPEQRPRLDAVAAEIEGVRE